MDFFSGWHQPSDAQHFRRMFVSITRLLNRRSTLKFQEDAEIIVDSGAFNELRKFGKYRHSVQEYGAALKRLKGLFGNHLVAAVTQDYMCETFMLERTGMTVYDHQRLTIERYDSLLACDTGCYIMPVLQGYRPEEYVEHIRMYGDRITPGAWVGVGSVCKRNGDPRAIESVLLAIHTVRPDLRLHGFGLKKTALTSGVVWLLLYSCDSLASSFKERMAGRSPNDWRAADRYAKEIDSTKVQWPLFL
jgi:hypothetical protein